MPVTQRAQTIAEYLEDVHWKNDADAGTPQQNEIIGPNNADETPFTLEELSQSLIPTDWKLECDFGKTYI